jgi:hypothetical protein
VPVGSVILGRLVFSNLAKVCLSLGSLASGGLSCFTTKALHLSVVVTIVFQSI